MLCALYVALRAVCAARFVRAAQLVSANCAARCMRFVLCCALYALYVALRAHYNKLG